MKSFAMSAVTALTLSATIGATVAQAAQLGNDAKAAIPKDVMQIIVVDYRAMQN